MRIYYNVNPRYSAGSPAMVDKDTALKLVDDECMAHQATLEGIYGPERVAEAKEAGLHGIVEEVTERADCWLVTDLITARQTVRMFPSQDSEAQRAKRAARLRKKYNREVE